MTTTAAGARHRRTGRSPPPKPSAAPVTSYSTARRTRNPSFSSLTDHCPSRRKPSCGPNRTLTLSFGAEPGLMSIKAEASQSRTFCVLAFGEHRRSLLYLPQARGLIEAQSGQGPGQGADQGWVVHALDTARAEGLPGRRYRAGSAPRKPPGTCTQSAATSPPPPGTGPASSSRARRAPRTAVDAAHPRAAIRRAQGPCQHVPQVGWPHGGSPARARRALTCR